MRHPQRDDTEDNVYVNGDVTAGGSKPELIYAQIDSNPPSSTRGRAKVNSPNTENGAVIYSELENVNAPSRTVAPSNDLYAIVRR